MNTNIIPVKTHGLIDYATAASLIAMPLLLSRKKRGKATWLPMLMGAGIMLQNLMTSYEGNDKDAMKMDTHLKLDYFNGALLAAAPFLFGFRKKSWFPHVAIGLSEVAIAYFTQPETKKRKILRAVGRVFGGR